MVIRRTTHFPWEGGTSDVKFFFIGWWSWVNAAIVIQRTRGCSRGLFVLPGERCWPKWTGRPFRERRQRTIPRLKGIAHDRYRPSTGSSLCSCTEGLLLWGKRGFQVTAKSIQGRVRRDHRQVWEGQLPPRVYVSLLCTLQIINVKPGAAPPCFQPGCRWPSTWKLKWFTEMSSLWGWRGAHRGQAEQRLASLKWPRNAGSTAGSASEVSSITVPQVLLGETKMMTKAVCVVYLVLIHFFWLFRDRLVALRKKAWQSGEAGICWHRWIRLLVLLCRLPTPTACLLQQERGEKKIILIHSWQPYNR